MILTRSQKNVVELVFGQYKINKQIVNFKAPTGSGKTFMAAHIISKILATNHSNKIMVVIATVSNAELPKAFARKLENYKKFLNFSDFEVEFRESPSSKNEKIEQVKEFRLENNKVLVFGTSSFGKKKIFTEQKILDNFIYEAKEKEWKIIYIRDEAHKGSSKPAQTKELEYANFDEKMINLAFFTLQMTATPKNNLNLIELTNEQLKDDNVNLLKEDHKYNSFQQNSSTSVEIIEEAFNKFEKIKQEYKKLDIFIRPALLIQVDSKNRNITQEEYNKTIYSLIAKIKKRNWNYLKYFSNDVESNTKEEHTLESASKLDSSYDIIIFKVGPATGWDIPRACMLLQIREVSSDVLNKQTIGRIKRNPLPGLKFNKITNKYYIYSNYQEGQRDLLNYCIKDDFKNKEIKSGKINFDLDSKSLIRNEYTKGFEKILNNTVFISEVEQNHLKKRLILEENSFLSKGNNTHNVSTIYIENFFRLKIFNNENILLNKTYFNSEIINLIKDYCFKTKYAKEIVFYTLLKTFLDHIKKVYAKSIKNNFLNIKYSIDRENVVHNYSIWKTKQKVDVEKNEKYGYTLILGQNMQNQKNIQFLDSHPERIFLKKIIEIINKSKYKEQVSFLAKMPTFNSKIYFEYISTSDYKKHKSYIDFCLELKNKKILMVEVKSQNHDYDEKKTLDLIDAYSKYEEENDIQLKVAFSDVKKNLVVLAKKRKENSNLILEPIEKFINEFLSS